MGPSFDKIPEIELPPVLMTWKICLLKVFFKQRDENVNYSKCCQTHFGLKVNDLNKVNLL